MRAGFDRQIVPPFGGLEISARGRGATTIADRILATAEAFLLLAVVILGKGMAALFGGFEPRVEDRVGRLGVLRAERPLAASPCVLPVFPGLGAIEVRQHVGIGPAKCALLRPTVIVAAVAA